MVAVAEITKVLGDTTLKRRLHSIADLEHAVEDGLPKSTLDNTVRAIVTDRTEAQRVRNRIIPPATYKRRRSTLNGEESQRVERLARVIATAFYVWDDHAKAQRFMLSNHSLLEGRRPLDVAVTDLGARRVEELLWGLFYGLPV